jgi:hypothetical protein
MVKLIIYGFLIYLLYKFIFELVIPVSKATTQVKDKLREMQQMQEQQNARDQYTHKATSAESNSAPPKKSDDYIEFEDLKS